jgi:hypothetical protein
MNYPFIMGRDFVTVMADGQTVTVLSDAPNYRLLRQALRDKEWDKIPELLTPAKSVETFVSGDVQLVDGQVMYNGKPLHNSVTRRIMEMMAEGFDATPLRNFLSKLMQNPSKSSVDELYDWLEHTRLPICEDGDFMAYKKVRDDLGSFYDYGKTKHVFGEELPEMPRNQVDDNRTTTCSTGYHFCSLSYLPHYHGGSGRVLLVKVNPAKVVSIPNDYNFAKGRATTYRVIGEHTMGEQAEAYSTPVVNNAGQAVESALKPSDQAFSVSMGVNFGTPERARMVNDLVSRCGINVPGIPTMTGAVDGLGDAKANKPVDLSRFSGNMRDAVEYALEYFRGYDHAMSNSSSPSEPVVDEQSEIARIKNMPVSYENDINFIGHAAGYDSGFEDGECDAKTGESFDSESGLEDDIDTRWPGYREGYIEGYSEGYHTTTETIKKKNKYNA